MVCNRYCAGRLTRVHGSQHACDELVDSIAFRDERNERRDTALVVRSGLEVREDELLEGIDLVLQGHEVGDCLITVHRQHRNQQFVVGSKPTPHSDH